MNNLIQIIESFTIRSRSLFVINCSLLSGQVNKGMHIVCENISLEFEVNAIEYIRSNDEESLGLTFKFDNSQTLEQLINLVNENQILGLRN